MTEPAAHRTAIIRGDLSRPTRFALELGLLNEGETFFDYGCGRGEDIARLRKIGFDASGWDPHHRPDQSLVDADVVNIGYVINVIADPRERRQALSRAWSRARKALIVAARLNAERRTLTVGRSHGDGFMTGHGTFQRFFDQSELRDWIDTTLEVESIAAAPGIFIVFRAEEDANTFILRHRSRRRLMVNVSRADRIYDMHREALDHLISFFSERGRLPVPGEDPGLEKHLHSAVGSVRRAWSIIERVTDQTDWASITSARTSDLLVDLALLKLNRRPNFNALPPQMRYDVRALIGSYRKAICQADDLLFSAGNLDLISASACEAPIGKRLPTALYVHNTGLELLPAVLRVYEGCARWLVGDIGSANIVKLATDKPKVSYLSYPKFDTDPHPALVHAMYVRLQDLNADSRSYADSPNPPILHRKEQFVPEGYPRRATFARLTEQEERFGLLAFDIRLIGNREGWNAHLKDLGVCLRGHRIVKSRP